MGEAVRRMSIWERGVLTNMAAELGAETGLIEADEVTLAALRSAGREPAAGALDWRSDPDANYLATHDFSATLLPPQVAAPHAPSNSGPVGNFAGVAIDQAYIGACVGAKLSDLHMVAEVLKNRTVARGTRLLVAPASTETMAQAAADGTLATLTAAGAYLLPTGCGACAALGAGCSGKGKCVLPPPTGIFRDAWGQTPLRFIWVPLHRGGSSGGGPDRGPPGVP